jgi:hypothetical protein
MISQLHFEVQDLKSYFDRHKAQASKAHTHGLSINLVYSSGTHYVDYEEIDHPKQLDIYWYQPNSFFYHIRTTKESLSISTIFSINLIRN